MTKSRYEKYISRGPIHMEMDAELVDSLSDCMTMPPYMFNFGNKPIKDADSMLESIWTWKDSPLESIKKTPPHSHDFAELWFFIGSNIKDPYDLGADISFWMGDGEASEEIHIKTSSLIYVPGGLVHLPVIYRNVIRPVLTVIIGLNTGPTLEKREYPPRQDM